MKTKDKPKKTRAIESNKRDDKSMTKQKEFDLYVVWRSMPSVLLGKSEDYLNEIGIKEKAERQILGVKTQKEFAKVYKVRESTLSKWNKKISREGLTDQTMEWAKGLTKNIIGAFYHSTLQNADAHRVRLWFELFEGKEAEGGSSKIFSPQLHQTIINLGREYDAKLKETYKDQIKKGLPSAE